MTHSFESKAAKTTESPEFDQSSILVSPESKARISKACKLCENLDEKVKRVMMATTRAAVRAASMIEAQATAANEAIFNQRTTTFEEYKKAA